MKSAIPSLLVGILLISCTLPAQARLPMMCWDDAEGARTCSDVLPPAASDYPRKEFGLDGIPRREVPRALTEEEIEQQRQLQELRERAARIRAEQEEADRRLLQLYPTIEDLLKNRDVTIADMDSVIEGALDGVRAARERLARLHARAAEAERRGQQPSSSLLEELAAAKRSIGDLQSAVVEKQAQRADTLAEFEAKLERYRELRPGEAAKVDDHAIGAQAADRPIPAAVHCATGAECDRLWDSAKNYVRRHATTPVELAAARILATAPPRRIDDISITLTRQADVTGKGERIFMDIQCADFAEGRSFCLGPEVAAIRNQFRQGLGLGVPE
jgi:hypothetical protein